MNNTQLDPNLPKLNGVKAVPSNTSVAFEWQPMTKQGITGYNIYRTKKNQYINSQTKTLEKIATIYNPFSSHYVDTNIKQGAAYTYTFTTLRGSFESPNGQVMLVRTLGFLEPITYLKAFQKSQTNIKLLWRPHPNKIIKMYRIERSVNGSEWKWIDSVPHRMMSEYIDIKVIPGNSYKYRVIAVGYDDSFSKVSRTVSVLAR